MIGTPRKAMSSRWCTSDGPRKRRGRVATRTMATTTSPRKLMPAAKSLPARDDRLPDLGQEVDRSQLRFTTGSGWKPR